MAVLVPGGLMGACADLMLLSSTGVLLGTGDRRPKMARALVPARALRALPGVTLRPAGGRIEAVRLVFAEEEAIWANTGVLVHCPRGDTSQFPRLEAAEARAMLRGKPRTGARPERRPAIEARVGRPSRGGGGPGAGRAAGLRALHRGVVRRGVRGGARVRGHCGLRRRADRTGRGGPARRRRAAGAEA